MSVVRLALLVMVLFTLVGCADSYQESNHRADGFDYFKTAPPPLTTLEERISSADLIVKGRLTSAEAGWAKWAPGYPEDDEVPEDWDSPLRGDDTSYMGTMELTFSISDYLKGTGDNSVVAVVLSDYFPGYLSTGDALAHGTRHIEGRETSWDNRDAILFLHHTQGWLVDFPADRYFLGWFEYHTEHYGEDFYTIASPTARQWLPAESKSGGPRGSSGNQKFLLAVPAPPGGSGLTRSTGSQSQANSISLATLNTKIQAIEQEVADAGGTDEARNCIASKYETEAWVEHRKEQEGGVYETRVHERTGKSGQPAGTEVFRTPTWNVLVEMYGETEPPDRGRYEVLENDAHLFSTAWPGRVLANRPLPTGRYRFYHNLYPQSLIPCDGQPEERRRRWEVVIFLTAPAGTVHEAFFDPVSSGDAVGYFGTGDALKPTTFSKGDTNTTIQSLKWQDSAVTLGLSPYNALAGHILDFITGDGTTALSLEANVAMGDSTAGTLTWAVGSQPWSSGDELMLRFRNPPPVFSQDSYTFSIPESHPTFSILGRVEATDSDGEAILYVITSGRDGGRFDIDGWLGDILLIRGLDYESTSSYELTVEARDPSGGKDTATVTIEVTDVAE